MQPTLDLVRDNITPTIKRYSEVMGRDSKTVVLRAAKGVTRRVSSITPPGSAGVTGAAAYRQGRTAIAKDLNRVLAPVKLKRRRVITMVFGRRLANPITVKTTEQYPDVAAAYRSRRTFSQKGLGVSTGRARQKIYVDRAKFRRLQKSKEARVGRLAAGWAPAANAVGINLPTWIRRHGAVAGGVVQKFTAATAHFHAFNLAPNAPTHVRNELARRIPPALRYQQAAMEREINYMVFKRAQQNAIATRNFSAFVPAGMFGGEAA